MMALTKELINKALTDAQGFGIIKNRFTGSFESEVWYGLILDRMKLTTQATYPAYVEFNKQIHKFVIHISPVMAYELFKEMVPNETLKPLSDETQEDAEYKAFTAFLRGLIKHETMHVIFKHLINVGKQIDHSLANVCQDSLINLGIDEFKALGVKTVTAEEFYMVEMVETGKMNVPGVAMIKGSRKLNNYTWEELYQMLLEDPNYKKTKEQEKVQQWFKQKVKERLDQQEQQSQKGDQPQDSDEQGQSGQGQPSDEQAEKKDAQGQASDKQAEQNDAQGAGEQDNEKEQESQSNGKVNPLLGDTPIVQDDGAEDQAADEAMNQLIDQVINDSGFQQMIGKVLGNEFRKVLDSRKPKINWKKVLRNTLGRQLTYDFNYTWLRPNRRFDDLEGKKKKFRANVLAMLDVSGSINNEMLSQFLGEVDSIVKNAGGEVDVVTYDYGITGRFKAKELKHVDQIVGGGGTSLSRALNQLGKDTAKYDAIVVLTDGYDNAFEMDRKVMSKLIVVLTTEGMYDFVGCIKQHGGKIVAMK